MIICGTMGSPNPVKVNRVGCGVHNWCVLGDEEESYLEKYEMWR